VLATYVGRMPQTIEQAVATPMATDERRGQHNYMYSLNSAADGQKWLITT